MLCDKCQGSRSMGLDVCMDCGADLTEPPKANNRIDTVLIFGVLTTVICAAILIFEAIAAFYLSLDVFPLIAGYVSSITIIMPMPISVLAISGSILQGYYIFLLIAMALSVGFLFFKAAVPFFNSLKNKKSEPAKNTALFEMSVLFAALYAVEVALILLLEGTGTDVSSPLSGYTNLELAYVLLEASVWEEVISRILLIGVPMLIIATALKDKEKKARTYILGGFGMSLEALVFIFFSAVVFGLAHLSGWDLWKFLPTFIFGLIAGYLFVKYGVYATICMHFLTDYLSSSDWIFADDGVVISMLLLFMIVLGIPYVWIYTKRGVLYLKDAFKT